MYTNKEIWNVSYPIFLGLLAQNIINVTDTAFLGRVGEVELGASAMGGLFYICVFTIAFGFSVGSQILIARRNGELRYKDDVVTVNNFEIGELTQKLYDTLTGIQWGRIPDKYGWTVEA